MGSVKHSLSPVLHNYWFNKYSLNAEYNIIEATEKDLPSIVKKIKNGFSAGNVTLPFKQKILNHVDKAVNDAEPTGSINTVFLDKDKSIIGENTDVYGLQAAYLKEIDYNFYKKSIVIGAGGVSPSIILSLKSQNKKYINYK